MTRDQEEDAEATFSGTLPGINELRDSHAGDDDWKSWRRMVIRTVNAGARLEKDVTQHSFELRTVAKQSAVAELARRIKNIEELHSSAERARRGLYTIILSSVMSAVTAGVVSVIIAKVWHIH